MKINISPNLNLIDVLRRAGYGLVRDNNPEQSFARRLGRGFYPRFHAYINEGNVINLHLDQKQVSYRGQSKHSGEYDGPVVENEGARIAEVAASLLNRPVNVENKEEKGGSFWQKLFK